MNPNKIIALLLFFLVSLPAAAEFRDLTSVTNLRTSHFRPECSYRIRYLDRISDYHFYQVTNAYVSYSVQQGGTSDKTRVYIETPMSAYEMKQLVTAQKPPLQYTSAPDGVTGLRLIVAVTEGMPAVAFLSFSMPGAEDLAPVFLRPELFALQRECVRSSVSR